MTGEMVKQVCDLYTAKAKTAFRERFPEKKSHAVDYAITMCEKTKGFIDEGRTEKAMRWLGFIQGVFWTEGVYSIDEMRAHNTTQESP